MKIKSIFSYLLFDDEEEKFIRVFRRVFRRLLVNCIFNFMVNRGEDGSPLLKAEIMQTGAMF